MDIIGNGAGDDLGVQVIKTGSRFIEQEDGRRFDEGAGDGGTLLLAAGERAWAAVSEI